MPLRATAEVASNQADLPDLRDFIRGRRAALAGFMEQGASLKLTGDTIAVIPRNDIYVRYLSDNRNAIAELASELYGRRISVVVTTGPVEESNSLDSSSSSIPAEPNISQGSVPEPQPELTEKTTEPAMTEAASATVNQRRDPAEARQALYADPVVRRIFNEFEARLVEVRADPRDRTSPEDPTTPKR
jgi:hypothetical protein